MPEEQRKPIEVRIMDHLEEFANSQFTVKDLWRVLGSGTQGGASEVAVRRQLFILEDEGRVLRRQATGESGNPTTKWRVKQNE